MPLARKALANVGPVFDATFERLTDKPRTVLAEISLWMNQPLDLDRAVSQLRPRSTGAACLPYMLEEQMIQEKGPVSR
jgi:hypothetical protein